MAEAPKVKPEIFVAIQRQRFLRSLQQAREDAEEALERQCEAYRRGASNNEARG